jgi:hypothetical protein
MASFPILIAAAPAAAIAAPPTFAAVARPDLSLSAKLFVFFDALFILLLYSSSSSDIFAYKSKRSMLSHRPF